MGTPFLKQRLIIVSLLFFASGIVCKNRDPKQENPQDNRMSSAPDVVTPEKIEKKYIGSILPKNVVVLPAGFIGLDAKRLYDDFKEMKLEKDEYEKRDEYIKRIREIIPDNVIAIQAATAELSYDADSETMTVRCSSHAVFEDKVILIGTTDGFETSGIRHFKHYGVKTVFDVADKRSWGVIHTYTFKLNVDTAKMIKDYLKVVFVVRPSTPEKCNFISKVIWNIDDVYPMQHHEYFYFWGDDLQIWTYSTKNGEVIDKYIIKKKRGLTTG